MRLRPVPEPVPVTYLIGLGSNLGDRRACLRTAIERLAGTPGATLVATSRLYDTSPLTLPGAPSQPRYLNAAVRLETSLDPEAMLARCLEIERSLGRVRDERWGPRTIDLDVLVALDASHVPLEVSSPTLTLPHPGLSDRAFALAPLLDVAPELAPRFGPRLDELGRPEVSDAPWI